MCSRKGMPVLKLAWPVPSRLTATVIWVSSVLRTTWAVLAVMGGSCGAHALKKGGHYSLIRWPGELLTRPALDAQRPFHILDVRIRERGKFNFDDGGQYHFEQAGQRQGDFGGAEPHRQNGIYIAGG